MKKISLSVLAIILFGFQAFSQQNKIYEGGLFELLMFVNKNIQYPSSDRSKNIQGKVVLEFKIDADRSIDSINVLNSVSENIDSEAIRSLRKTNGRWITDKPEWYAMLIHFKLDDNLYDVLEVKKKAKKYIGKENYDKAIVQLDIIRRDNPIDFLNQTKIAQMHNKAGRKEEAMSAMGRIKKLQNYLSEGRIIHQAARSTGVTRKITED